MRPPSPIALPLTAVIADDEPDALNKLRLLLGDHPDIQIVAECSSGLELLTQILRHSPSVAFLDIEMPCGNAFEVLAQLESVKALPPYLVFVTAHEAYAYDAIQSDALDYLVKPFDARRLDQSVRRIRERIKNQHRANPDVSAERLADQFSNSRQLILKRGAKYLILRMDEIESVQQVRGGLLIHTSNGGTLQSNFSPAEVERRLKNAGFVRVNRHWLVNPDNVRSIYRTKAAECIVEMQSGRRIQGPKAEILKLVGARELDRA
jgi:two-component system, LytTR family, response regulator